MPQKKQRQNKIQPDYFMPIPSFTFFIVRSNSVSLEISASPALLPPL